MWSDEDRVALMILHTYTVNAGGVMCDSTVQVLWVVLHGPCDGHYQIASSVLMPSWS